jgi:hypothetical protein
MTRIAVELRITTRMVEGEMQSVHELRFDLSGLREGAYITLTKAEAIRLARMLDALLPHMPDQEDAP